MDDEDLYVSDESGEFRRFDSYRLRELGLPKGFRKPTSVELAMHKRLVALGDPEAVAPWPVGKLFVWDDPYSVSYGTSLFFAVAENLEQAKKLAKRAPYGHWKHKTAPQIELGEPSRVLDLPCGEWHEWSE
jgi:hypothetical protein